MEDNQLVPVKRLYGHRLQTEKELEANRANGEAISTDKSTTVPRLAILDVTFHPTQPWLLTAGADGNIGLFSY